MAASVKSIAVEAATSPDALMACPSRESGGATPVSALMASWERTLLHTFEVFRASISGATSSAPELTGGLSEGAVLQSAETTSPVPDPGRHAIHQVRTDMQGVHSPLDIVLGTQLHVLDVLRGWLSGVLDMLADVRAWQERQGVRLEHLSRQMVLAADLQRELLPKQFPTLENARLDVFYHPRDHISGDLYDVFRVDDRRVAWGIADAVGHGLSAGMMSALLKRGLRRMLPGAAAAPPYALDPAEVLRSLNQDLLVLDCRESHYIAAAVAVYDETTRELCWARCGMPYPIHLSVDFGIHQVGSEGMLLGVCDNPPIEVARLRLKPGDVVLFHSDGLESLVSCPDEQRKPHPLNRSSWFTLLGRLGLEAAMSELQRAANSAEHRPATKDDVTVLALEVRS